MQRSLLLTLALVAPLTWLAPWAPDAQAYVRAHTLAPYDKPFFWKALSVPYVLDAAGAPGVLAEPLRAAVGRAFQTWATIPCSYLRFEDRGVAPSQRVEYVRGAQNTNAVLWVTSNWPAERSAAAKTFVTSVSSTGEILDADIALNAEVFRFSAEDGGVRERIDVEAIVAHEVGHFLGLDHSPVPGASMGAYILPGDIYQRDLSQDDLEGACAIYPRGMEPILPTAAPAGGCAQASDAAPGLLGGLLGLLALLTVRRRARGDRAAAQSPTPSGSSR